jgi:hypothetical protein
MSNEAIQIRQTGQDQLYYWTDFDKSMCDYDVEPSLFSYPGSAGV